MGGTRISSQGYVPEANRLKLLVPSGGVTRGLVYQLAAGQDADTSRWNTVATPTTEAKGEILLVAEADGVSGDWTWFQLSGEINVKVAAGVAADAYLYVGASNVLDSVANNALTSGINVKVVGRCMAAPGGSAAIVKCVFNGEYGFGTLEG